MLPPVILYEDEQLIAISKPAGMVVNRSANAADGTVQDWLEAKWPQVFSQPLGTEEKDQLDERQRTFSERTGIAHRIDKDTSGVLLIAKDADTLFALFSQFQQRQVKKKYLTLVHGKVLPNEGMIDAPILRHPRRRTQFTVGAGGRESQTNYQVLRFFPSLDIDGIMQNAKKSQRKLTKVMGISGNFRRAVQLYQGFSYIEVTPLTGRTHQIRVHFASQHHPVVGDEVYAGKKRAALDSVWCPRQFLHAAAITFQHPRTAELMALEAELPQDLHTALQYCIAG